MEENKTFGIISEGVTDQIVLERILYTILNNEDIFITRLQPKENETGNWDKVFKYCESLDFKASFGYNDFIIIQIDSDFMLGADVGEKYKINMNNLSNEEIINSFRQKIIELIGENFYQEYQHQIIFAIAVHEIECWFLPIYFNDNKSTKITNCINTLNTVLFEKEDFYINDKEIIYYEKIVKNFKKIKDLKKYAAKNKSLSIFLEELEQKIKENNGS